MLDTSEKRVIKAAITSRLVLILLQFATNLLLPDHEADAFRFVGPQNNTRADAIIWNLFGGFVRWDAHHFMHIARYGYIYEHSLAFFPLCPLLAHYWALIIHYFTPFLSLESTILLTFLSINTLCFVLAALCLYELTGFVGDKNLAFTSCMLFCFNPASVFFTAPYTEALFCYLTFKSMLNCVLMYKRFCDNLQVKDVFYIVPICLSVLTRSNGVLNIGFLAYALICLCLDKKKFFSFKFLLGAISLMFACLGPFVLFQKYAFDLFCHNFATNLPEIVLNQANTNNFVLAGTFSKHNQSWCHDTIPLAYSYVQSHYWKVGFFEYYQLKQIPNFLLAAPIIYILLRGALQFYKQFPKEINKLFNFNLLNNKNKTKNQNLMVVFVVHSTFLTIFCVFNIHVQVTTRMLCSASPVVYWFSANYLLKNVDFSVRNSSIKEKFILCYYFGYFIVGTAMFCNFLPWT